jgi:uncharacterized membrane protein
METPGRLFALDWLRGLAVLVMIQTHALALLQPGLRQGRLFHALMLIDGLVAPTFLFTAGCSLGLVMARAGSRGTQLAQARRSLGRIGQVLLAASFINFAWFPVLREPKWWLRIDILHCVALSLLALLPVLLALAPRPRVARGVTLAMALGLFAVAPLGEGIRGAWSLLLNNHVGFLDASTGAMFPLLPWAGYVFLGGSLGVTIGADGPAKLWGWWGVLLGLGLVIWAFEPALFVAYPPHQRSLVNPSASAQRWTYVLGAVAGFRGLERGWAAFSRTSAATILTAFGTSSLSAYVFHELLLFEHRVGFFGQLFRDRATWWGYGVLWVALVAATWLAMAAWDRLTRGSRYSLR